MPGLSLREGKGRFTQLSRQEGLEERDTGDSRISTRQAVLSPARAPAGHNRLRKQLVTREGSAQTSPGELPSLLHCFCSRLQADLGFPNGWLALFLMSVYRELTAGQGSVCLQTEFECSPSVVCFPRRLGQGSGHACCFASRWRQPPVCLCVLQQTVCAVDTLPNRMKRVVSVGRSRLWGFVFCLHSRRTV